MNPRPFAAFTLALAMLLPTGGAILTAPALPETAPPLPTVGTLDDLRGMITDMVGTKPALMEPPHWALTALNSPAQFFSNLPRSGRTAMDIPLAACLTGTVRVPTDLPEVIAGTVCIENADVVFEKPEFGRRILEVPASASLTITNSVVRNDDGDRLNFGILEAKGGLTLTGNTFRQIVVNPLHTQPETVAQVISNNKFTNTPYGVYTDRDLLTIDHNTFSRSNIGLFVEVPPDGAAWKTASNPEVHNNTFEANEIGIVAMTCTECSAALGTYKHNVVRANIIGIAGYSNGWVNPDDPEDYAKAEFLSNNVYDNWGDAIQGIRGLTVLVPGVGNVVVLEDSRGHYDGNHFGTDTFFLSQKDVKENDASSPVSTSAPALPFPIRVITSATTWDSSNPPPALTGPVVVKSPGSLTVTGIALDTEHTLGSHKGGKLTLDDVTVNNGNGIVIRNDADVVKNSDFIGTRLFDMVTMYRNNGTANTNVFTGASRDRNAGVSPVAGLATDDFVFSPTVNGNTLKKLRYGVVANTVALTFNDNKVEDIGMPKWAEFQNQDTSGILMVLGTLNSDGNTFKNALIGLSGNIATINSESDTFEGAFVGYMGIQLTTSKFNKALFANNEFGQWAILDTSSTVSSSNYTYNGYGFWVALNSATITSSNFFHNYLGAIYPYSSTITAGGQTTFTTSTVTCTNCWAPDDENWYNIANSSTVWTSALSPNDTPSPSWKGKVKEASGSGSVVTLADGTVLEAPVIARKGGEIKVENAAVDLGAFNIGAKGGGNSAGATGKLTIDRAILRNGNFIAANSTAASIKNSILRDFTGSAMFTNVWNGATVECTQFDSLEGRPARSLEMVKKDPLTFRHNRLDHNKEVLGAFKLDGASLGGDAIHQATFTFEENAMVDGTSIVGAVYVAMNGTMSYQNNNLLSNFHDQGARRRQQNNTIIPTTPTATQATGIYYGHAGGGFITFRDDIDFGSTSGPPQVLHNGPGLDFRTQRNITATWPPPLWNPYATEPNKFEPCIGFTFTPVSPFDHQTVAFNSELTFDPSGFDIASYSWNFNGEGSSSLANPAFKFPDGGSKTVTLTVTTSGGKTGSLSKALTVVHSAPAAGFTSNVVNEITNVDFTDTSTHPNAPVDAPPAGWAYAWDFGDGSTSSTRNPSHRYADGGPYTVQLTVTDNDGQSNAKSAAINVPHVKPVATFAVTGTQETDTYQMTDTSTHPNAPTDGIVTRAWSCSDGFTSTAQNPTHKFADGGSYSCTLTVTDNDSQSDAITKGLSVAHAAPAAGFTNGAASELQDMAFTDTSTHPNAPVDAPPAGWAYAWDFGDGSTSSARNPAHNYADGGAYSVALTVTDNDGQTHSVSRSVSVTHVAPVAAFSFAPANPDPGELVGFTDLSTHPNAPVDGIAAWAWDFGEGSTSTLQNPTHAFAGMGLFDVRLCVTDNDLLQTCITLKVPVGNNPPVVAWTYSPLNPTDLDTVQFTDQSTDSDGTLVSWLWDFGDGATSTVRNATHKFADNGDYAVSLTVTDNLGATTTLSKVIPVLNVGPTAGFTYGPNNPQVNDNIQFADTSSDPDGSLVSWAWDFGDGTTSAAQNPTHSYAEGGDYVVKLTVSDDDGAQATTQQTVHVCETQIKLFGGGPLLELCLRIEL